MSSLHSLLLTLFIFVGIHSAIAQMYLPEPKNGPPELQEPAGSDYDDIGALGPFLQGIPRKAKNNGSKQNSEKQNSENDNNNDMKEYWKKRVPTKMNDHRWVAFNYRRQFPPRGMDWFAFDEDEYLLQYENNHEGTDVENGGEEGRAEDDAEGEEEGEGEEDEEGDDDSEERR